MTMHVWHEIVATPFVLLLLAAYFVPAIVARCRHHQNAAAILVLNLLLGWTFLGWIAAMVWASTAVEVRR
jgi:hypothetical protein